MVAPFTQSADRSSVSSAGIIPEGVDPKEWKQMVKEAKRERRKLKMKKSVKKSKVKKRQQK